MRKYSWELFDRQAATCGDTKRPASEQRRRRRLCCTDGPAPRPLPAANEYTPPSSTGCWVPPHPQQISAALRRPHSSKTLDASAWKPLLSGYGHYCSPEHWPDDRKDDPQKRVTLGKNCGGEGKGCPQQIWSKCLRNDFQTCGVTAEFADNDKRRFGTQPRACWNLEAKMENGVGALITGGATGGAEVRGRLV